MVEKFFSKFLFISLSTLLFIIIGCLIFYPIFFSNSIIIPYSLNPYDICIKYPNTWNNIKLLFILFYIISSIIVSYKSYNFVKNFKLFNKKQNNITNIPSINPNSGLSLYIGMSENNEKIFLR